MTIGIEGYSYRGYDLVHFTKTGVTLVHAHDTRTILHQARSLEDAQCWIDRLIRGRAQDEALEIGAASTRTGFGQGDD